MFLEVRQQHIMGKAIYKRKSSKFNHVIEIRLNDQRSHQLDQLEPKHLYLVQVLIVLFELVDIMLYRFL